MSNSLDFSGGSRPPKSIINSFSTTGAAGIVTLLTGSEAAKAVKVVGLGATTANVLKTVLSVTGAGQIDFLGMTTADGTARTLRIKVTIDGTVVFDSTTASIALSNGGISVIGIAPSATSVSMTLQPTFFNTSLLVEAASSLTEATPANVGYNYRTT